MSFNRNWTVKRTRKPCRCEACSRPIDIGSTVERWAGMSDDQFYTCAYHVECRAAEIEWNTTHGTFPDEWMGLSGDFRESDDDAWLAEHHPIVAERLGIKVKAEEVTK